MINNIITAYIINKVFLGLSFINLIIQTNTNRKITKDMLQKINMMIYSFFLFFNLFCTRLVIITIIIGKLKYLSFPIIILIVTSI